MYEIQLPSVSRSKLSQIKPLAPIRSSDRRKIADKIIADFGVNVPDYEDRVDNADDKASPASSLGALRNSLLPENALSARFTTTAGPDLSQVSGNVYAGAHPGEDQRVLWFKLEERLIPTGRCPGKLTCFFGLRTSNQSTLYGGTPNWYHFYTRRTLFYKNYAVVPLL